MKQKIFSILIALAMSLTLNSQNIKTGLVAHYKFDNNANDASLYENNGKISGGVKPVQNRFNIDCSAYEFDGRTGYIEVENNEALEQIENSFSVTVWAKLASTERMYWFTICCKGNQRAEDVDSPHFRFQVTKINASINTYFTGPWNYNFKFDEWYFLAVTKQDDNIIFYVNGEPILDTIFNDNLKSNKEALIIGKDIPGRIEFFQGTLDDLRIFNRGLTEREIKILYSDVSDKNQASPCEIDTLEALSKIYTDLPQEIENKPIIYQNTIFVKSKEVTIIPYDDEIEDNDTISININGIWVREYFKIKNKRNLYAKDAIKFTLDLKDKNYLISKAWNLGTHPPNTLAIDIYDGSSSPKHVIIHSDIGYSGAIRIVYRGP